MGSLKKDLYKILSLFEKQNNFMIKNLKKTILELKSNKKAHPDLKTISLYEVGL